MRDALSLLDQAIAHAAAGRVEAGDVRAMLGLSDRGEVIELVRPRDGGRDRAGAGVDGAPASQRRRPGRAARSSSPNSAISSPAPSWRRAASRTPAISENERKRGAELAQRLGLGPLTRAWQILIKGVEDVKDSPRPLASAEMALIRLAFAADLPTPEEALRRLAESGEASPRARPLRRRPRRGAAIVELRRRGVARSARRRRRAPKRADAARRVSRASRTSSRWRGQSATSSSVRRSKATCGSPASSRGASSFRSSRAPRARSSRRCRAASRNGRASAGWWRSRQGRARRRLREQAAARQSERLSGLADHPVVRKILERFPGARIVDVRAPEIAPRRAGAGPATTTSPTPTSLGDDDL